MVEGLGGEDGKGLGRENGGGCSLDAKQIDEQIEIKMKQIKSFFIGNKQREKKSCRARSNISQLFFGKSTSKELTTEAAIKI